MKPTLVMLGVPAMVVPLDVKVTVPVGPAPLLVGATTVAVNVTGVVVVTPVDGVATIAATVGTAVMVSDSVLELAGGL